MRSRIAGSATVPIALMVASCLVIGTVGPAVAEASHSTTPLTGAGLVTMAPEDDPDVVGFAVTGDTTMREVVDSIVETEGTEQAVAFFDEAADAALVFPGLGADSPESLGAIAEALAAGRPLDANIADLRISEGRPLPATGTGTAPSAGNGQLDIAQRSPSSSQAATALGIAPGVKANHAVANGYAWEMKDYLAYYECRVGPLLCSLVDRIDFRFRINPGTKTTRIDENFTRVGNRKISQHVTVKAEVYSVGKVRGTDYDEWSTPGKAIQWVRTSSGQGGKKIRFKMTFTALTPVGVASGSGWTNYTKACSKSNCQWNS